MTKVEKIKILKSIFILLTTLLFPIQLLGTFFYFIPPLYTCIIVPFLLWTILIDKENRKVKAITFIWKIPIIFLLACCMGFLELVLVFAVPVTFSFIAKSFLYAVMILLLRIVTYVMMIFILQFDFIKSGTKWWYLIILAYCIAVMSFAYSTQYAKDTDNEVYMEDLLKDDA